MAGRPNDQQGSERIARDKETGETQGKFEFKPVHHGRRAQKPQSFKIPSPYSHRRSACERGTCEICRRGFMMYEDSVGVERPLYSPGQSTYDSMPVLRLGESYQVADQHRRKRSPPSPRDLTRSQANPHASFRVRPEGHLELSDELYSSLRYESLSELSATSADVHKQHKSCRIPSSSLLPSKCASPSPPQNKIISAHKKRINIQCWREFIMGKDAVTDQSDFSEKLICKYKTSIPCLAIESFFARYVCTPIARILCIICFMLMVFLPCISLGLSYLYRLHVHRQIHARSEDLGIEVQYTGGPIEGPQAPLIYCVRYQSCTQCRYNRQAKLHLKYHERQKEERNKKAV